MVFVFVLYAILVAWAAKDGDMYAKEIAFYAIVWVVMLAGFLLCNYYAAGFGFWFVVPTCLIDIYLVFKLIGNPSISG